MQTFLTVAGIAAGFMTGAGLALIAAAMVNSGRISRWEERNEFRFTPDGEPDPPLKGESDELEEIGW